MRVFSQIYCQGCKQHCEIVIEHNIYACVYFPYTIGDKRVSVYVDEKGVAQSPVHTSFVAALEQARQICAQCKKRTEYTI